MNLIFFGLLYPESDSDHDSNSQESSVLMEHLFIKGTYKFNYESILQTHSADDVSIYSMI